ESRSSGTARDSIAARRDRDDLFTVSGDAVVSEAILILNREGIDPLPGTENGAFVGSISRSGLLEKIINDPKLQNKRVKEVMDKPMMFVAPDSTLDVLSSLVNKDNKAVLVRDEQEKVHIITQHDILRAVAGSVESGK